MQNEKPDTRTKILETAADIIGREKNLNLTIRDIANKAGVNVASVNYYFGSKDNLMAEVQLLLMERIRRLYDNLGNSDFPASARLIDWADSLIKHLIEFPGIIYLIGTRVLERSNTGLDLYLKLLETEIFPLVKDITCTDDQITGYKVLHLISGLVYPVLIFSSEHETAGLDISNPGTRRDYVISLVKGLSCSHDEKV